MPESGLSGRDAEMETRSTREMKWTLVRTTKLGILSAVESTASVQGKTQGRVLILGFDDIRCAGATDRAMAPEHYRCRHHVYSREKRRRQRNSREFGAVGFKQTCNLLLRAQHHQAFRSHHQPLPKPSLVVLTILADIIHIHSPQFTTIFIQVRSWLLQC